MSRHFIAVVPNGLDKNPEVKRLMGKLRRTAEERGKEARWVAPSLWHVTLAFLGELDAAGGDRLRSCLLSWKVPAALELRLHGLGAFPSVEEGRVLWMGVHENQAFLDMQSSLALHLIANSFALGDRDYNPHLTLARFRNLSNLSDMVGLGGRKHFGDYLVSELVLFESVLQGNILKYVPQFRMGLRAGG